MAYSRYQTQPKRENHYNFKSPFLKGELFLFDLFTLAILAATSLAGGFHA